MFARIVEYIPRLQSNEEFLKKSRPSTRMQEIEPGGTANDETALKWARELALILFVVLIVLVISIARR